MDMQTALNTLRTLDDLDPLRRRQLISEASAIRDGDALRRFVYVARAEAARAEDARSSSTWFETEWARRHANDSDADRPRIVTFECPPEHNHDASQVCYSKHGCRCDECSANMSEIRRRRRSTTETTRTFRRPARTDTSPAPLSADDDRHGTWTAYSRFACRCAPCRAAGSEYKRVRRAAGPAEKKSPATHGSTTLYQRGCRCEKCRAAMSEYGRARREAKNKK